ncbi:NAD(P)-dependent oxidoreductase [Catelliglobosispora koreensis]|uniref:NAD(P)-dependent oxidoreductase n=1 Tax=Catelliglobosispora koreensis TaxID=129052 RepID=UPI000366C8D6|nr:NAD(P)H-binding protein [Catelliglobosispora koreensis]
MRLTVFGATGGIGKEIVRQALASGHKVTAVVRNRLDITDANLTVVTVPGLSDPELLVPALEGADAVLSGVGPRGRKDITVASSATRGILTAMKLAGVRRFVAVSAWPVGPTPAGENFAGRYILRPFISTLLRGVYADLAVMEKEIAASGAQWTVVWPPQLKDGPLTGRYRSVIGANVPNARHNTRADVAHLMLATLSNPDTVNQPVGIG